MNYLRVLLFVIVLVSLPVANQRFTQGAALLAIAAVQSSNTISCGQTLTGNISAIGQQDTYTFSANAGEAVNIAAVATSGTLAARLELYNPSNTLIGSNGGGNSNTGNLTLPATGVYTILVRDFGLNRTGMYALNLQFTSGRCAVAISCGETKTGNEITQFSQQDTFTFSALAGEAVNIAAVATSGTLAARLELYNPSNTLIGSNGGGNNNTGSLVLPATGVYKILVRDFGLNRIGRYALNLQFTTGRCGTPISGGQTLSGSINSAAEQDSFVFFGQQGGSVNISAVATLGTLAARAEVYRPAGMILGANGGGNTNTGILALQETGVYTILVRDFGLNRTGNYNINLTCLGNGCSPAATIAITPASQTIATGTNGNLTVTINPTQSTATTVTLNSTNPAVATVPASVTIAANATSASFTVTGVALGTATLIAALPTNLGGNANASITVAQPCQPNSLLPNGFIPFSQIYYITGPNATGDRLVVGKMPLQQLNAVPLPSLPEQRFCTPVELVAGLSAISYVPTANERSGDFSAFAGQLIDPLTGAPFTAGLIPANRLGDPHAWRIVSLIGGPATVSGASYSAIALASESIASAFGARLATSTATVAQLPLPTVLAGTSVKIIDGKAVSRDAPLFFVSPDQVNFLIPAGTSNGAATIIITNGDGSVFIGVLQIATVAPGLFTANQDGAGAPAGFAIHVKPNSPQSSELLYMLDPMTNKFAPKPIDLGAADEIVILELYGTGIRGRTAQSAVSATIGGVAAVVEYADKHSVYVGLDQVNVRVPRVLIGRGEVDVELTVDGKAANAVKIAIK